jgi:hypothetical protein
MDPETAKDPQPAPAAPQTAVAPTDSASQQTAVAPADSASPQAATDNPYQCPVCGSTNTTAHNANTEQKVEGALLGGAVGLVTGLATSFLGPAGVFAGGAAAGEVMHLVDAVHIHCNDCGHTWIR